MKALTQTQQTILTAASLRPDGNIEPLPKSINAGIKATVINSLLKRGLIDSHDTGHRINKDGLNAIGTETAFHPDKPENPNPTKQRQGTKQAKIITLMQRPEGASIEELSIATGWQKHTVLGVFSNTLKKRLGLTINSYKEDGQSRKYRLTNDKI